MIIGIPREAKADEHRVSLTPDKVDLLVRSGHAVLVEDNAGAGANFPNAEYERAGASLCTLGGEVFERSTMIVKVKEPQPEEYELFHQGQILFTFLHLAPAPELTQALLDARVAAVAYETIQQDGGALPLLYPMSEIAGRLAAQVAARLLLNPGGGPGKLLGGVPGTEPARVVVVGGGTVGFNAAQMAMALGAHVMVADINLDRLRHISSASDGRIETLVATPRNVSDALAKADVVIGAVLVAGAKTPKVITRLMVEQMRPGSLIIDVAIDQGGSVEDIRPTTHEEPTYAVDGVMHYAVPNMPGIAGNTSSVSLSNATYPYVLALANDGLAASVRRDSALAKGVNTFEGRVTYQAVAEALGLDYVPLEEALAA